MNIKTKSQIIWTLSGYGKALTPQDEGIVTAAPGGKLSEDAMRRFEDIYEAVSGGRYERPPYFSLPNMTLDTRGNLYYKGVVVNYIMPEYGYPWSLDAKRTAERTLDRCLYLERIGVTPTQAVLEGNWPNYAEKYMEDCLERLTKTAQPGTGLLFTSVFVGCGFGGTVQFLMAGNPTLDEIRQSAQYKDFLTGNDLSIYLEKEVYATGPDLLCPPTPEALNILESCFLTLQNNVWLHKLAGLRYDFEENTHEAVGTVEAQITDHMAEGMER